MSKIYEFLDKHYCEEDLSETDELYVGDLDDMWDAMCDSGYYHETTFYCTDEHAYDDIEDLINDCVDVIGETNNMEGRNT